MSNDVFKTLGRGRMCRVSYTTVLPVKAEYKKQGVSILKCTESTMRTGVAYKNLPTTIGHSNSERSIEKKQNNYDWIIPNVLRRNHNTGKVYFYAAPLKQGNNSKTVYVTTMPDGITISTVFDPSLVIDSYFKGRYPAIVNIAVENIVSINGLATR